MPYRVLARKYRPATFAELIGQEAMVRTLTNAIQSGRLPQAWMLTGVRGIGKTTTARIIAKALNCTGRDAITGTIEPCNACDSCRAITEDRFVDVQELDAASRTGVDDIREIVDGVRYGPVAGKYKIYILDEVHMLSKNAFNALLKTLEEPPPHTKFIFATTEIRKVPVTILSRCQRFDLRRIESVELAAHFTRIAGLEDVSADPDAIKLIAHAADGSVRDGLSLLDQAIALGNGRVALEDVKNMLGLADRGASLDLCRHVLLGTIEAALAGYDQMIKVGTDPLQILQDMAELIHRLTRAQILMGGNEMDDVPEGEKQLFTDLAAIKIPALTRAWQILLKGIGETQAASQPAMAAEMALIRVAYAAELPPPSDLIKQLREQRETSRSEEGLKAAPSGSSEGGGVKALRFGGSSSSGGNAARRIQPQAVVEFQAVALAKPMPQTFRDVAQLFATNREGGLYAELCRYVHPVRMAAGQLTIRVERGASAQLVGRLGSCLNEWTEQRWMIAVVDDEGLPTLAQEDEAIAQGQRDRAAAHPLMKAVLCAFPEAKLRTLESKPSAPDVAVIAETDVFIAAAPDEEEEE